MNSYPAVKERKKATFLTLDFTQALADFEAVCRLVDDEQDVGEYFKSAVANLDKEVDRMSEFLKFSELAQDALKGRIKGLRSDLARIEQAHEKIKDTIKGAVKQNEVAAYRGENFQLRVQKNSQAKLEIDPELLMKRKTFEGWDVWGGGVPACLAKYCLLLEVYVLDKDALREAVERKDHDVPVGVSLETGDHLRVVERPQPKTTIISRG